MLKIVKFSLMCLALFIVLYVIGIAADKQTIRNEVVRFHVLANSDDPYDQNVKMYVRNIILDYLNSCEQNWVSQSEAKEYLHKHLGEMEELIDSKLKLLGIDQCVKVTLTKERFEIRTYDTFTLPSGVYDSLRVELGEAKGKNWWCVIFPTLCMPETVKTFEDEAVQCGFDQLLVDTISNNGEYEIRFYILDCIGRIENFFYFQ